MLINRIITFTIMVFIAASACGENLPKTASLLPAETFLLMEIPDCNQLQKQFQKTNLYKIYKEPAMAAFFEDFKQKWHKGLETEQDETMKTILDQKIYPQERLAFALIFDQESFKKGEPYFLLMAQWGQNIAKIKDIIDKQVAKDVEKGSLQKSEEYQGVKITTLIKEFPAEKVPDYNNYKYDPNTNAPPPMKTFQPPPVKTNYCYTDDCLITSTNIDIIKFVIAKIKGSSSPTLSGDNNFISTMQAVGPYHDIDVYVNIKSLITMATANDSNNEVKTYLTNLGVDNISSFGSAVGVARKDDSSYCGKATLKINGPKKGVLKIMDMQSAIVKAPRFLPANTSSVTFLNINIKNAYNELYNILNGFSPSYAAPMSAPLVPQTPEGQPAIYFKPDIIDHLGSEILVAKIINKPFTKDSSPLEYLFAVAVDNRQALEKSLALLHKNKIAKGNPDASRELLGYTIYTFDFRFPFMRPGPTPLDAPEELARPAPKMQKMAFTITNTHLIFGLETMVEKAIRTINGDISDSLTSSSWFNKTKTFIPSAGLASLKNDLAESEFLWWSIKSPSQSSSGNPFFDVGPIFTDSKEFNMSLLPEFEVIKKYLGCSEMHATATPEGFTFEFRDIYQPEPSSVSVPPPPPGTANQ